MRISTTLLIAVIILTVITQAGFAQCERQWQGMLHIPGLSGPVRTASRLNDDLYLGGEFRVGGLTYSRGIIRYRNGAFESLDNGFDGRVNSTVIFNGQLVAAGAFTQSGTTTGLRNIAQWNGSQWQPLGAGFAQNGAVSAPEVQTLTVFQNQLVAAGRLTVGTSSTNLARFDGTSWAAFSQASDGTVLTMTPHGDSLILGGDFTAIGSVPARNIARIDASGAASRMGSGVDAAVRQLAVINNQLIAAGDFSASGIDVAEGVAAWNGTRWTQVADGLDAPVYAIAHSGGITYASASQSLADPTGITYALLNNHWTPVQISDSAPKVLLDSSFGLLAAGEFQTMDTESTSCAAFVEGGTVRPLCTGTNGAIHTVINYQEQLIVSGDFTIIEGVPANHIAAWDGQSWHALAGGLERGAEVSCIWNDELFVAGPFQFADGRRVNYIARWDGATWRDCDQGADAQVRSMAVFRDKLYVGGDFEALGPIWCRHLATWDGSNWQYVTGPAGLGADNSVTCMSVCESALVIGGPFLNVTGVRAKNIAYYNGVSFAQIADGLPQAPEGIITTNNATIPFGFSAAAYGHFHGLFPDSSIRFVRAYVDSANYTRWRGSGYAAAGDRAYFKLYFPPTAELISVLPRPGGSSLIRNEFGTLLSEPFVDGRVRQSVLNDHNVVMVGDFSSVNSSPTPYLASNTCPCRADFNRDRVVDLFDYLDFVAAFVEPRNSADVNLDWNIDFFDYLDFIQDFSTGC